MDVVQAMNRVRYLSMMTTMDVHKIMSVILRVPADLITVKNAIAVTHVVAIA